VRAHQQTACACAHAGHAPPLPGERHALHPRSSCAASAQALRAPTSARAGRRPAMPRRALVMRSETSSAGLCASESAAQRPAPRKPAAPCGARLCGRQQQRKAAQNAALRGQKQASHPLSRIRARRARRPGYRPDQLRRDGRNTPVRIEAPREGAIVSTTPPPSLPGACPARNTHQSSPVPGARTAAQFP
jgi:hypothetical protein